MSGTTAVTVLIYENTIVCGNAGDSRAVMFSKLVSTASVGGSTSNYWKPTPLSRDHKPDDIDEANRIRACNGRVEQSKILPGMALMGMN